MDKREAGRLGGLKTSQKYGRSYMSMIGKRGYQVQRHFYRFPAPGFKKWLRKLRKGT